MRIIIHSWLALLLLLSVTQGFAADEKPESLNEEPVEDSLVLSETGHVEGFVELPLGDELINATFIADKTGRDYGKVLILPDSEGNIDSNDLVHTLRMQLTNVGWSTMTVELVYPDEPQVMPSAESSSESSTAENETDAEITSEPESSDETNDEDQNRSRVAAAVAHLNAQQPGLVAIVAMGKSAELTDTAIAQVGKDNALIWISPQWQSEEAPDTDYVLDITLSDLLNNNDANAKRRAVMLRKDVEFYSQRQIPGATTDFYGFEQPVFNTIRNWLHKHFVQENTNL
ncbi:DUF3530 family protein [Methylophaga sp.]|uniref:DUF3530 family protein n=1 Tax=Methylophaga sp. TaxID=2024840 RepID=UPI003F6997A8